MNCQRTVFTLRGCAAMSDTVNTIEKIEASQQALLDDYRGREELKSESIRVRIEPYLDLKTMQNPQIFSSIENTLETYQRWLPTDTSQVLSKFKDLENSRRKLLEAGADAGINPSQPSSAVPDAPSFSDRLAAAAISATAEISSKFDEIEQRVHTWWKNTDFSLSPKEPYGSTVAVGETSHLREKFSADANPPETPNENPAPQDPAKTYAGYHYGLFDSMNNTDTNKPPEAPRPSAEALLTKYGVLSS